jgi:hypothetical protein
MTPTRLRPRHSIAFLTLILGAVLGVVTASGVGAATAGQSAVAGGHATHNAVAADSRTAPRSAAQNAFHDQMRKTWEDHVTWTRLAIVTFADGSGGFSTTAGRLLQNQTDIGDSIKPYYGVAAGNQLTSLLHDHITIAVEIMTAAKAGDTAAFNAASARWYVNGNDIADFLAAANPRSWPQDVMRADMKTHLDQTLSEAAHELHGEYAAGVTDYDGIHAHILMMADQLSDGIMAQFPSRFR